MRTRSQAPARTAGLGRAERGAALAALVAVVLVVHLDLLLAAPEMLSNDPARVLENEVPTPVTSIGLAGFPLGRGAAVALHVVATLGVAAWLGLAGAGFAGGLVGAAVYGVHPLHSQAIGPDLSPAVVLGHAALAIGLALAHGRARWAGLVLIAAGVGLEPRAAGALFVVAAIAFREEGVRAREAWWPTAIGVALGLVGAAALPAAVGWGPPPPVGVAELVGVAHASGWMSAVADHGSGVAHAGWLAVLAPIALVVGIGIAAFARGIVALVARFVVAWVLWAALVVVGEALSGVAFAPLSLAVTVLAPAAALGYVAAVGVGARRWKTTILVVALGLAPLIGRTARDANASATHAGWLAAARENSPGSVALERRRLARGFHHNANRRDLLADYERFVAENPADARGHAERGRFLWSLRRLEGAIRSFERANALAPARVDVRYWLAASRYLGRRPRAAESLRGLPRSPEVRALEILIGARNGAVPPAPSADDPALVLRAIGIAHAEAGRFEDGLDVLDRAAEMRPRDSMLAAYRGWCRLGLGRVEDAIDLLSFDALRDESGFLAHKLLAELRAAPGPKQDRRAAFEHLRYFIRHDPSHPDVPRLRKLAEAIAEGTR